MRNPDVIVLDPRCQYNHVGEIPSFLNLDDPRPAREQLHANYAHGGGWDPQPGFTVSRGCILHYPGDPPFKPLAAMQLRKEIIFIYPVAYVAIFQTDGTFEVCRMD